MSWALPQFFDKALDILNILKIYLLDSRLALTLNYKRLMHVLIFWKWIILCYSIFLFAHQVHENIDTVFLILLVNFVKHIEGLETIFCFLVLKGDQRFVERI